LRAISNLSKVKTWVEVFAHDVTELELLEIKEADVIGIFFFVLI